MKNYIILIIILIIACIFTLRGNYHTECSLNGARCWTYDKNNNLIYTDFIYPQTGIRYKRVYATQKTNTSLSRKEFINQSISIRKNADEINNVLVKHGYPALTNQEYDYIVQQTARPIQNITNKKTINNYYEEGSEYCTTIGIKNGEVTNSPLPCIMDYIENHANTEALNIFHRIEQECEGIEPYYEYKNCMYKKLGEE